MVGRFQSTTVRSRTHGSVPAPRWLIGVSLVPAAHEGRTETSQVSFTPLFV